MNIARGNPGGNDAAPGPGSEWFAHPDETGEPGLRFSCTMCGNCCTGPEGYVLVSDDEIAALAKRFGMSPAQFRDTHTHIGDHGRSLNERQSEAGRDCVFLDREKFPGRAVCGVYEDRPAQCRTWPFWKSNVVSRYAWRRAKHVCPGMDRGKRYTPLQIRIERDKVDI